MRYNSLMNQDSRLSTLRWVAGEKTPPKTYVTRVFNWGTWDEWRALKREFPPKTIRDAVLHPLPGQWTPRGRAFAEVLFDCRLPEKALISFDA